MDDSQGCLLLTHSEVDYIINMIGSELYWPLYSADGTLVPGAERAGGTQFRLKLLALNKLSYMQPTAAEILFYLSRSELWLLDTFLSQTDFRQAKLPDGQLVLTLMRKIWEEILMLHGDQLPEVTQIALGMGVQERSIDHKTKLEDIDALIASLTTIPTPIGTEIGAENAD